MCVQFADFLVLNSMVPHTEFVLICPISDEIVN